MCHNRLRAFLIRKIVVWFEGGGRSSDINTAVIRYRRNNAKEILIHIHIVPIIFKITKTCIDM